MQQRSIFPQKKCLNAMFERQQSNSAAISIEFFWYWSGLNFIGKDPLLLSEKLLATLWAQRKNLVGSHYGRSISAIVLANIVIVVENAATTTKHLYSDHSIGFCTEHQGVLPSSSSQILTPMIYPNDLPFVMPFSEKGRPCVPLYFMYL